MTSARGAMVKADAAAIDAAARILRAGGLVAFPTETVYGLGADATQGEAVARIYAAKGRPAFNPLIAHVATLEQARQIGVFSNLAGRLAEAFWPGPLTLVVPAVVACPVSDLARAGLDSLAIRIPAHSVARALIAAFGRPVVAPSANKSGRVSPTTAAHVREDFDAEIDLVLDGGRTHVGVESTIVSCLDETPRLLRPGGLARDRIEAFLQGSLAASDDDAIVAPGMLTSHYAPHATVRLNAIEAREGEAILDFGEPMPVASDAIRRNLSVRGDLVEAAANLFAHLRALDASGAKTIAVAPIPDEGLGEAINDRLARAAAER
jgi:L-threonylcarbamoyladenylate synthase